MPIAYAVDTKLAEKGKTTFVTVASPLSAMTINGHKQLRNFAGEATSTVVFVEATIDRATEWIKPEDLQLHEFSEPPSVVRSRGDTIRVGLLDGRTLRVPDSTSPDEWRFAVDSGDQRQVFENTQPATVE